MGRGARLNLPADVLSLLADADAEERAIEAARGGAFDAFITSDYEAVWRALATLEPEGRTFLEWGSGLGVVSLLAARRGFAAHGIELRGDLVRRARALADRHGLEAEYACGTFFPDGFEPDVALLDEDLVHGGEGADGYAELGVPLEEFDVVFGFPWPGEEELFLDLFRRAGGPHATLLLNLGRDGIRTVTPGPG
ncbi:MAG: hypothetical protein ACF8XB_04285 [Planctomycetota bacterium JB042]